MSAKALAENEQLKVEDLVVRFYTYEGIVKAVEKANLTVRKGETLGIVGETGSGKSVTGLTIMALTPTPGKVENGRIYFRKGADGVVDILQLSEPELLAIRGKEISMIFQEPKAALDPLYTVGEQISEAILTHRLEEMTEKANKLAAEQKNGNSFLERFFIFKRLYRKKLLNQVVRKEIVELLRLMEICDAERVVDAYPHELSGGMQQRIVIAIALSCNPTLLLADEPTTNLDVTVQAQIISLIMRLKKRLGASIIYITHDMGVIAEISDRVAVMYAGSVVEVAPVMKLFKKPLHPYTNALLNSIPKPSSEFISIPGTVPNLVSPPTGCRFHPRCKKATNRCSREVPELKEVSKDHLVACHNYGSH